MYRFVADDRALSARAFLDLAQRVWPGDYEEGPAGEALQRTLNSTAWQGNRLVGCVRVLTDGYFFGTVPEILVDPDHQGRGLGQKLMDLAWTVSPTSLFLGAQPGREGFFEKCGFERGMEAFVRKKPRRRG